MIGDTSFSGFLDLINAVLIENKKVFFYLFNAVLIENKKFFFSD